MKTGTETAIGIVVQVPVPVSVHGLKKRRLPLQHTYSISHGRIPSEHPSNSMRGIALAVVWLLLLLLIYLSPVQCLRTPLGAATEGEAEPDKTADSSDVAWQAPAQPRRIVLSKSQVEAQSRPTGKLVQLPNSTPLPLAKLAAMASPNPLGAASFVRIRQPNGSFVLQPATPRETAAKAERAARSNRAASGNVTAQGLGDGWQQLLRLPDFLGYGGFDCLSIDLTGSAVDTKWACLAAPEERYFACLYPGGCGGLISDGLWLLNWCPLAPLSQYLSLFIHNIVMS